MTDRPQRPQRPVIVVQEVAADGTITERETPMPVHLIAKQRRQQREKADAERLDDIERRLAALEKRSPRP